MAAEAASRRMSRDGRGPAARAARRKLAASMTAARRSSRGQEGIPASGVREGILAPATRGECPPGTVNWISRGPRGAAGDIGAFQCSGRIVRGTAHVNVLTMPTRPAVGMAPISLFTCGQRHPFSLSRYEQPRAGRPRGVFGAGGFWRGLRGGIRGGCGRCGTAGPAIDCGGSRVGRGMLTA